MCVIETSRQYNYDYTFGEMYARVPAILVKLGEMEYQVSDFDGQVHYKNAFDFIMNHFDKIHDRKWNHFIENKLIKLLKVELYDEKQSKTDYFMRKDIRPISYLNSLDGIEIYGFEHTKEKDSVFYTTHSWRGETKKHKSQIKFNEDRQKHMFFVEGFWFDIEEFRKYRG